ncbi:MAG: hypothetical protein JWN30_952 [Bacilli bacterium]|nr:hypothetical protein [Bacilli bacterium]
MSYVGEGGSLMEVLEEQKWWSHQAETLIENDGLAAVLLIHSAPEQGQVLSEAGLHQFLAKAGVVFGIDLVLATQVVLDPVSFVGVRQFIAQGIAPIDGENARVTILAAADSHEFVPKLLEDGRVDFFDRGPIQTVRAGQLLATKTPPTEGQSGISVTGGPVPARIGRDVRLPVGSGTQTNDEDTELIAMVDGRMVYTQKDNKLNVFALYELETDVDFSTGNIEFIGSVHIRGNVQTGFKVIAAGEIVIEGYIDAAYLEAGGNVVVRGGIQGRSKGYVRSGGSVTTRFIQNALVETHGDCIVQESIMHSRVTAAGSVAVKGRRAVIVGGVISAGSEVHTRVLGSPMATPTEVEVGVHPELRAELNRLHDQLAELKKGIDKTRKALTLLNNIAGSSNQLSPDKLALHHNLVKTIEHYKIEEIECQGRKEQIEVQLQDFTHSKVVVQEVAHSGVKLTIGQLSTFLRDDLPRVAFIYDRGEIRSTAV